MKSFSNRISDAISGKKTPGLNEICTLLNFEDMPAALVDTSSQSLLFINSKLMKIVSYSTQDTWQKPVGLLFPEINLSTVSSGEVRNENLVCRDRSIIPAKVRFEFIDPKAQWIVIKFLPESQMEHETSGIIEETFRKLTRFLRLEDSSDLQMVLNQSVGITRDVLAVDSVCLYQVDPEYPQLKRIAVNGTENDFPEFLPSTDMVRLENSTIWRTGTRVLTELHRYARVNMIDFMGSAPLIQGEGAFGLLAVAGRGEASSNLNLDSLELMASMILSQFQQNILIQNLHDKINSAHDISGLRNITFDNMSEGVIILTNELKIEEINPAAEWMLGYAGWEIKGQTYENILIGTDRLLPALVDAQNGITTHSIGKATLNRRNGQSFPVQIKVIPVFSEEKLRAIELLISDISEHEQSKALTQQLEHRAVLGDYTAAFAHDVRNPINNISTGLQLLGAKLSEDDPNQDVINRMQSDCTRLNHLMESFLAFSRPLELKFEPIEVEIFLKRILDRWQPRMARVNVQSILHVEGNVDCIVGDPRSLEQVFTNLISNALEAMVDNGDTLAIKAVKIAEINGHPSVEISISDNGPGIPMDIQEHIFEPFVTTRQKGTGLGLAITKQIVNAHKGSIRVESFPGGTIFTVQLPAEGGE